MLLFCAPARKRLLLHRAVDQRNRRSSDVLTVNCRIYRRPDKTVTPPSGKPTGAHYGFHSDYRRRYRPVCATAGRLADFPRFNRGFR